MKIKINIPNILFFFDFFNPLKQNKDQIFKPKTFLKTCCKTLVKVRNFALKKIVENQLKYRVFIAL